MWVTKLLISPVKKRIFCPKTTKFGPKLAFLVNLGQAMQAYTVPCWWVGWWLWRAGCISQETYLLYDVLALLDCLLFGMFLHYVCLEGIGSDAHVVAVFTGKGPLPSVRLHVFFKTVRLNAGKVALVTLKRPLP